MMEKYSVGIFLDSVVLIHSAILRSLIVFTSFAGARVLVGYRFVCDVKPSQLKG
jgi:hypothetical protein